MQQGVEGGTEEGLYLRRKNHGNFFAKNHDLTLRLHKILQPNVHPTILMQQTFSQKTGTKAEGDEQDMTSLAI